MLDETVHLKAHAQNLADKGVFRLGFSVQRLMSRLFLE